MRVSLVVAVAENGVIGRDGGLPWRIPGELARFKALTMGKPVIMGRKTFESIGKPLPGRTNIVITRNRELAYDGAVVVGDFDGALVAAEAADGGAGVDGEVIVIGGAEIYAMAMPRAARLYWTEVHQDVEGDTVFPPLDRQIWREISREFVATDGADVPDYSVVILEQGRK